MEKIEKYCYTKKDFDIQWFSGTGPGGQNRNKNQNCVRIRHLPSGLEASCTRHRNRKSNFSDAFQNLGEKLERWVQKEIQKENPERIVNNETIRTYHIADNRVKDHVSGYQIAASELDKKFGELIEARRAWVLIHREDL